MNSFITHAGYAAVILFGFLEACCVPIPSEVTFGFAGVLAFQGHLNLALVIVAGTLAELAGSYVSYGVGRVAERPVVERLGRYLLITKADIDRAERFLAGRGAWAIPLGRALPFVRSFTSVVAGFAGVPALRFGVLSLIGTLVYGAAVASIGYGVGSAWQTVSHDLAVAGYIAAAIAVVAIVAFVLVRLRAFRREQAAAAATAPVTERAPDNQRPNAGTGQPG
ncbi:MAG: DedA family protein [Actinobacteria bacterium]|nr:DedA family protein [Actinomycetota bacterium]MBO0833958.1 DedA family protein [Actinomycetota bacterium]